MILSHHRAAPSEHVMEYVRGRLVKEGRGLSFLYVPQMTRIVSVPLEPAEARFEFRERSSDFQRVRVEGEVVYKVTSPRKAALATDFTVGCDAGAAHPCGVNALRRRVLAVTRDTLRDELGAMSLEQAIKSGTSLGRSTRIRMTHSRHLRELGVTVLAVFVREIRGPPELVKAIEAEHLGKMAIRTDPAVCDSLLMARDQNAERGVRNVNGASGPGHSIECNADCPFRHMCEDYMSDVRGGRAWCTLFREFSM